SSATTGPRTRTRAPTPLPRTAPGELEPAGPVEDGVLLGVRAWGVPVHPPPVPTPRPPPTGAPTVRRGGRGWPRPGRRTGPPPHRPYHPVTAAAGRAGRFSAVPRPHAPTCPFIAFRGSMLYAFVEGPRPGGAGLSWHTYA